MFTVGILNSARAFDPLAPLAAGKLFVMGANSILDGHRGCQCSCICSARAMAHQRTLASRQLKVCRIRSSSRATMHNHRFHHFTPVPERIQKIRAKKSKMRAYERECRPLSGGSASPACNTSREGGGQRAGHDQMEAAPLALRFHEHRNRACQPLDARGAHLAASRCLDADD